MPRCAHGPHRPVPGTIAAEYAAGATLAALAQRHGVCAVTVVRWLQSRGVRLRVRGARPKALPEGALESFRRGVPVNALSRETGMAFSTLRRLLLAAGETMRKPGQARGVVQLHNRKFPAGDLPRLLDAVRDGALTYAQIALQHGITRQRVGQIAKAAGLTRRSKSL